MAKRGRKVRRSQPEKFLSYVQAVAMLGCKTAGRGHTFNIGEQQAAGRNREEIIKFQQPEGWQPESRQSSRNFSGDGYALRRKAKHGYHRDRQRHDREPHRLARQETLAEQQQQDGNDTDEQHEQIDVTKLTGEPQRAIKKM
jgi:hypothetical protein